MYTHPLALKKIMGRTMHATCTCRITHTYPHTHSHTMEDEELARQLVELGYRGSGEVLKREEFEAKKQAAAASKLTRRDRQK